MADVKTMGELAAKLKRNAQLHRGFIESQRDSIRGPAYMSYAEHATLAKDADQAADAITRLTAERDKAYADGVRAAAQVLLDDLASKPTLDAAGPWAAAYEALMQGTRWYGLKEALAALAKTGGA